MAKFKCKITGTVVEFIYPADIETTRDNPAYEEINDGMQEKQETEKEVKKPRKVKEAE